MQPSILYNGETLAPNDSDLQRLQCNDRARIHVRWICGVKAKDGISSEVLLAKLHLVDATVELRTRRLRWFGHVKRSNELSSVMDMALLGKRGPGRPLKTFEACVKDDIKRCNLKDYDPLTIVEVHYVTETKLFYPLLEI